MVNIGTIILRPFDKNKKMWFITIVAGLTSIGLIGPTIGIDLINFNNEFIFGIKWGMILGIGLLWMAIWSRFPGKAM